MKNIVLFDFDNTLANMNHRLHLIDRADPDWDTFEDESIYDPPIEHTIQAARGYHALGLQVWVWTGRSDRVLRQSTEWLRSHGVPFEQLLMRPYGDETATSTLKRNWLNDSPVPRRRVLTAFDDDPTIVKMLQSEGVPVLWVRPPKDES